MFRAFSYTPCAARESELHFLAHIQSILHKLYFRVSQDVPFILEAFAEVSEHDEWLKKELELFEKTVLRNKSKPQLFMPIYVYLQSRKKCNEGTGATDLELKQNENNEIAQSMVLTSTNIQGSEPGQIEYVRSLISGHGNDLAKTPLPLMAEAMAQAARLVHPTEPCVLIMDKTGPEMRKHCDDEMIASHLCKHHVHCVIVNKGEVVDGGARIDAKGDLYVGTHRISLVYHRFGTNAPFSRPTTHEDMVAVCHLLNEFELHELIEKSNAVVTCTIGLRLAHRRLVGYKLRQAGGVERFLPLEEARIVRKVMQQQWLMTPGVDNATIRDLIKLDPGRYIAKPAYRQRVNARDFASHSGRGRDRNFGYENSMSVLEDETTSYILFEERVLECPATMRVNCANQIHDIQAVSEIAVHGCCLISGGEVLLNETAGFGTCSRPIKFDPDLSPLLGYGALGVIRSAH